MNKFGAPAIALGLLGAGGAGYMANEIMREDSAITTIENVGIDTANNCASVVLNAAMDKFVIVQNDPTTAVDEAYDSKKLADEEGQDFTDTEFKACIEDKLSGRVNDFVEDLDAPKFTAASASALAADPNEQGDK